MADLCVGIVGGTQLPGNVRTFLTNVRDLLADTEIEFQFDLIVRKAAVDDDLGFDVVDPGIDDTDRAIGTIRSLTGAITQYAQSERPDVLWQVTKFPSHGFATVVAGKRVGIPTVTRFAGDNFREYQLSGGTLDTIRTYALNNVFGRIPAAYSGATIALGPYGKDQITSRGGTDVREIPQPIDTDQFHPCDDSRVPDLRSDLGFNREKRVLLTIGRLSHRKGMDDLLATARTLARRNADIQWCVVGDGPMRDELCSAEVVNTVGRVPHEQIPLYYQAADLVVHPSLIEGLPNVLLEAAACGTPTLSRNVGDCAVAASETYDSPEQLADLVTGEYDPVTLGEMFDPDTLRSAYTAVLVETARDAVHGET